MTHTEAVEKYFSVFKIEYTLPPLKYEFQTPLFLFIVCSTLANQNLHTLPTGFQGFSEILKYYIKSINEKISLKLDYNPRRNLVQQATSKLIEKMIASNVTSLEDNVAEELVNNLLPNRTHSESLYYHLRAEGFLTSVTYGDEERVRFVYDRFTDHLKTSFLLDQHLDLENIHGSFAENQPLYMPLNYSSRNFRPS